MLKITFFPFLPVKCFQTKVHIIIEKYNKKNIQKKINNNNKNNC